MSDQVYITPAEKMTAEQFDLDPVWVKKLLDAHIDNIIKMIKELNK